ncbi:hypothetical protein [Microbacterium amylolyticum]|uniref:Uncharacterized protein n=1 Tax=Microbacterium amylolyticum TaxID=936337 RepID=A0ABS4ZFJ9_9MICO|nr:hypothetical protein [Microbacterium amylolyticum]MBP2435813.1 hypothetical protein [Microbacterium amylolyticum]
MTALRKLRPIALTTAAAVVSALLIASPAHAEDTASVDEASATALSIADQQNATLSGSAPFSEEDGVFVTDSGVAIDGDVLLLGEGYPNIVLPAADSVAGETTADGTVVFADAGPGLDVVVEAAGDGVARVLTVADEDYSDDPEHRYSYEVDLPQGAILEQSDTGTVFVLAPASESTEDAAVDLAEVLPPEDAEGPEPEPVLASDDEIATEEELAGDFDVPAGWEVVGAFQSAWSADATGASLPTHYEVDGNTLTQVVDTTGAQFPVVSDPIPLVVVGLAAIARALLPALLRQGAKALATQTIKAGVKATTKGGYKTFAAFKKDIAGSTPKGNQWHHIVEQSNISKRGWDARWVHNRNNLVSIPKEVHQKCVNSWMAKKNVSKFGIKSGNSTMRQTVHKLSFSKQHEIGFALLKHCGVTF